MKKLIMLGLAVLGLMTSCSNDELVTVSPANSSKEIAFSTHVDKVTRGTDITTSNINQFYVYGYTKASEATAWTKIFDNEEVNKDTDSWSYSNTQYWTKENAYIFHAIAGKYFDDNVYWTITPSSTNNYTTATINFDNWHNNNSAGTCDLLYAYNADITDAQPNGESFDPVSLNFKHLLSRVKIRFEAVDGDEYTDNPDNALYNIQNVRLVGAYRTAKIVVDGSKINNDTDWDNIKWTGYSKDDLIHEDSGDDDEDGFVFGDATYSNSLEEKKLPMITFYPNETSSSNKKSYFRNKDIVKDNAYTQYGYGETAHWYLIPVDAKDQDGYKLTFDVNLILATEGSTDDHTTGEWIEATGYADLSKVAIDMQKGYSYVYTIKINASKLKFTDDNQTHDPIVFDDIEVTEWKIDESINDFKNADKTDATIAE
jgi:hypothetical protein